MATEITVKLARPHTYQREILDSGARFVVAMCGRRFGKTELGVIKTAITAIDGGSVAWVAPTYKYLQPSQRRLEDRLKPAIARVDRTERRYELVGGGWIDCWSTDHTDDPCRGRAYDLVVVDEAGMIPRLRRIVAEAIRPALTDRQGALWLLGTPKRALPDFINYYQDGQRGDGPWRSWRLQSSDNPYLPAAEIELARAELTPEEFDQEYRAIPGDDADAPFKQADIDACVGRALQADIGATVVWGLDLAAREDYTWLVGLDGQGNQTHSIRFQAGWADTIARVIGSIKARDRGNAPLYADATGVGDPVVEELRTKLSDRRVEAVKISATSKPQMMRALMIAVAHHEVGVQDKALADELAVIRPKPSPTGYVGYSAPPGMHDDGVCALMLAWYHHPTKGHSTPVKFTWVDW